MIGTQDALQRTKFVFSCMRVVLKRCVLNLGPPTPDAMAHSVMKRVTNKCRLRRKRLKPRWCLANLPQYPTGNIHNFMRMPWGEGESKNSLLFLELLWKPHQRYPKAGKIHVILDTYYFHRTKTVTESLASEAGQGFALHILPSYCPDYKKIELTWRDLHANVTRNYRYSDMSEPMKHVRYFM